MMQQTKSAAPLEHHLEGARRRARPEGSSSTDTEERDVDSKRNHQFRGGARTQDQVERDLDGDVSPVLELAGVIKWFDAAKGYGFIVPDNGMPDIFLHVRCLRRDGFQVAYEGARVVVAVLRGPRGLQALRILSLDISTAIQPAQAPPRAHVTVNATSGLERAQVKWFNRARGFGFLTRGEGTPDIFVHMETLRRYGLTELRAGQHVRVRFGPAADGLRAAELWPDEAPVAPDSIEGAGTVDPDPCFGASLAPHVDAEVSVEPSALAS